MNKNSLVININNLYYNIYKIKKETSKNIMVVLKSNAYNMGARCLIKYLKKIKIDYFVFNKYCEYLECKDLLTEEKVLILEEIPTKYLTKLEENVRISVNSVNYIYKVLEKKQNFKIHIQVDTGMNREGIKKIEELNEILKISKDKIEIEGIYTHFVSDLDDVYLYKKQQDIFNNFLILYNFPIIHTAATSSLTKNIIGNHVRVGMGIYGQHTNIKLKNVVNAYTKVIKTRESLKGESVGYSALYTSLKDEKIAIIPVGYYEGFNEDFVYKGQKELPVIGKICMNHTFILVDETIKNSSWLNIFPKNDKINKKVNYYHVLTRYRNFRRIYIMEYQNDIRKIFKKTNKKSFKLRQRNRSN